MKIKGIPVGTTTPRPDWNQDNPQRADYIKNKPTPDTTLSVPGMFADAMATGEKITKATQNLERKIAAVSDTVAGIGLTATDDGTGVVTLQLSSEGGGGNSGGGGGGEGGSAVSPTIEITEIEGGHTVTVTDVYGSQSFDVMDGEKGEKGEPGPAGADGEPYELTEEDEAKLVAAMLASEDIEQMKQDIEDILAELNYENIDITGFSCPGAGVYEIGTSVAAPTITWSLNKEPASQNLNGEALGVAVRSKAYTGSIATNKTYTLNVTGQKGETDKASESFTFYNGVYYGALPVDAAIDSATILTLNKKVQGTRGVTFKVSPTSDVRVAYAIPVSGYGTPSFKLDNGFAVDMYRLEDPIQFENSLGYTTAYYVWLSTHPQKQEITVIVS